MLGYKHTLEAKQKMIDRYKKYKHPFLGKKHTLFTIEKISLSSQGSNNGMFGKKHTNKAKNKISLAISKPVYIYKIIDQKLELIKIFPSSVKLAEDMNLNKTTIGRYIKKGKIITWKSYNCILTRSPISLKI